MGGSPSLQLLAFTAIVLSPALAGLNFVLITLGLTPQALCLRLLRRLKQDVSGNLKVELCTQRSNGFSCVVRQNNIGAGAFDTRECFHHHPLFIDPPLLSSRFDHRVLT